MGLGMVLIVNLRGWQNNSDIIQVWPSGLAMMCRDLLATVPSDKVYGIAGLVGLNGSPGHLSPFLVGYSLDSMEVYMQFTFWCIQQEKSLDILAQQRNSQDLHALIKVAICPRGRQTGQRSITNICLDPAVSERGIYR
jgi:hypothetical protein